MVTRETQRNNVKIEQQLRQRLEHHHHTPRPTQQGETGNPI